ncbi:WhiB family transcriptional regulator [Streptomyces sp. NPDC001667]
MDTVKARTNNQYCLDVKQERFRAPQVADQRWKQQGLCTRLPPEYCFPEPRSVHEDKALTLCSNCPVQTECLAYALDEKILYGIFGGTTPRWRRQLLSRRQVTSWHRILTQARANHAHGRQLLH